jgi:UDPglucose 6-dehydrogenase
MSSRKRVTIFGAGYVGMSLAVLLSQNNLVHIIEVDSKKINKINNHQSTIEDSDIEKYLARQDFKISASTQIIEAEKIDYCVIATPTDYDPKENFFNTSSVETCLKNIINSGFIGPIIIKSTVPIGFTEKMREQFSYHQIIFSPEFLREGSALHDNLYPSRIIMGDDSESAREFSGLIAQGAKIDNIPILYMNSKSAESVKLFSNAYLAMRVAFFNELDSFAISKEINPQEIISGICSDSRIGNYYNNPSFGYGGYCLPKDTKQLLSNFEDIPQNIIKSIVDANETRKHFIADHIIKMQPKTVGIFRLIMKSSSDNFRLSAILDIMDHLKEQGIVVIVYEPNLVEETSIDFEVENNIQKFKDRSSIILANRISEELNDISSKVFTRDIFNNN